MAKKDSGLDALGAQYREAKASIAEHRRRQAALEVEYGRLARLNPGVELADLKARLDRAVADVAWCRAVTVAAGEAYKGVPFDQVPNDRAKANEIRARMAEAG